MQFRVTAEQDMSRRCCKFVLENVGFRDQPSEMLISGPRRSRRDRWWPVSAPWRPQGVVLLPGPQGTETGEEAEGVGGGEGGAGRRGGRREGKWKQVRAGGERSPGTPGGPSSVWVCPRSAEDAPERSRQLGPAAKQGWGPRRRGRVSPSCQPAGAPGTRRPFPRAELLGTVPRRGKLPQLKKRGAGGEPRVLTARQCPLLECWRERF